jgi:hypothetical protein
LEEQEKINREERGKKQGEREGNKTGKRREKISPSNPKCVHM